MILEFPGHPEAEARCHLSVSSCIQASPPGRRLPLHSDRDADYTRPSCNAGTFINWRIVSSSGKLAGLTRALLESVALSGMDAAPGRKINDCFS